MSAGVRRIAIIAVHGVGPHAPRTSAHAISKLLLQIPRESRSLYTSFKEECIAIPTRPVPEVPDPDVKTGQAEWLRNSWNNLDERPPISPEPGEPIDIEFMRGQLCSYDATRNDGDYDTVRLEGNRLDASGKVEADVHIYEMFWSDISQIGTSIFGIFGAFYQLVIHLPYVGGWALDHMWRELDKPPGWRALRWAYASAQRALTLFAPTLNIIMLALGLSLVTHHVPPNARWHVAKGVISAALVVLSIIAMYRASARVRSRWWTIIPFALAAGAWLALPDVDPPGAEWVLVMEWWILMAFPLWYVFTLFQTNRPAARTLGAVLYVLVLTLLIAYRRGGNNDPTSVVLHVLEHLAIALGITWLVFGAGLIGVATLGVLLSRSVSPPERPQDTKSPADDTEALAKATELEWRRKTATSRARAATYTARFALAFPAVAFSVATILLWSGIVSAEAGTAVGRTKPYSALFAYPSLEAQQKSDADSIGHGLERTTDTIVARKLRQERIALTSGGYFLRYFWGGADTKIGLLSAGVVALALLIVLATFLPAVITEWQSPRLPASGNVTKTIRQRAIRLGLWLSFAFRASRLAGELLCLACALSWVALILASPLAYAIIPDQLLAVRNTLSVHTGVSFDYGRIVVGAGTIGLIALLDRLSRVGLGIRPVLGIAVDVDNYLRELPAERTPRARMAERMTSLLRYLCDWRADRDDPNSGYDAVVIVAHSQGTVISADLLRYLDYLLARPDGAAREPRLARLALPAGEPLALNAYLFTMGSPLKQLYALRFPHMYKWITLDEQADRPTGDLLGVRKWSNDYRSGDYVGRATWRQNDQDPATYDPERYDNTGTMMERCIGPGAHTHYWDDSADVIGAELDAIVTEAIHSL